MADSTLTAIRKKIRNLTRSPSVNQISDADINEYVNTFVLYDMPASIKLNALLQTFTFYTEPYIDKYVTNTTDVTHPLYNFKNIFNSLHSPVYIDGSPSQLDISRSVFFNKYPLYTTIVDEGVGDGVTLNFTGTLDNIPVLSDNLHFSSISSNSDGLEMYDIGGGILTGTGGAGTIDYITGDYTLNFGTAPANLAKIKAHTVPYTPARPFSVLLFENEFTLRPVPDDSYKVTFDAYIRPTEILDDGQSPELEQWWEYIAYGAAIKVLEDRLDTQGLQAIIPGFKQQELLVERRTIMQIKDNHSETMYDNQIGISTVNNPNRWWNNIF